MKILYIESFSDMTRQTLQWEQIQMEDKLQTCVHITFQNCIGYAIFLIVYHVTSLYRIVLDGNH